MKKLVVYNLSFLLGFTLTLAILGTLALLGGCSNNKTPLQNNPIPAPAIGKWVDFGGNEPFITGNSFPFPCCNGTIVAGYFYTKLPTVPKVGQTLTINYTVTGNSPVWQNTANGGDTGAPTLHVFLWRNNDNLICDATTVAYRQFAGRTPLVLGANQTISVRLDPTQWTMCLGTAPTTAQFNDLLNNLMGAGFTFGGQMFAGHGIYLSNGNAQFTINSFTVQ